MIADPNDTGTVLFSLACRLETAIARLDDAAGLLGYPGVREIARAGELRDAVGAAIEAADKARALAAALASVYP